jgi:type II secretory pathway pseudopilin PulG
MPVIAQRHPLRVRALSEDGFTLILALSVMLITSLLLAAVLTVTIGEVTSTHRDTTQKQAYYAALAGVQEYEYQLQANPDYWQSCEGPKSSVPEEASERYEVTLLPASTAPKGTTGCVASNPFATVIQSEGALANTFRIKATGFAGSEQRSIVATLKVAGFLDFVYFTNFETEDPLLANDPAECREKYYSEWSALGLSCATITFTSGDEVNGPMHTNDAAKVEGTASFGRKGETDPDSVEIFGGTYPEDTGEKCKGGSPKFYTANECYIKGEKLIMPESDTSLTAYVEAEKNEFTGETRLVLNGTANTIAVINFNEKGEETTETLNWPKNGLIYVRSRACGYEFKDYDSDNSEETKNEKGCGNVYVSGTYSKSLTIGAEDDIIINGDIYPTSVAGKLGNAPTGTATLGLIASEYVRVYHPVQTGPTNSASGCSAENQNASEDPNKWGSMTDPYIYAAILSTSNSFLVDNYRCGAKLGELNVYGAIAQNYRGIVGLVGASGYLKDYKYDERLATDEPPYFLAPLKAGWKVFRETAPTDG